MLGPLFNKELLETARRRRYFMARVAAGFALLYVFYFAVEAHCRFEFYGTVRFSVTSSIGRLLFRNWMHTSVYAILVLIPPLCAGLIASEKAKGTFDVLMTTLLTDKEILLGKVASRLFIAFCMLLSTIPILAIGTLLGGIDLASVLRAAVVLFGTLVVTISITLYYSTLSVHALAVTVRTYIAMLVFWVGLPILLVRLEFPLPWSAFAEVVGLMSPLSIAELASGVHPHPVLGVDPTAKWFFPQAFLACYFALSALLLRQSHHNLRHFNHTYASSRILRLFRQAYRWIVTAFIAAVEHRKSKSLFAQLWKWELRSRSWPGLDEWLRRCQNPFLYRSFHANVVDPYSVIFAVQIVGWLAFLCFISSVGYTITIDQLIDPTFHQNVLSYSAIFMLFASTLMATQSIGRERERRSWESLLTTDVSPLEYLLGLVVSITQTLFPTLVMSLFLAVLFVGSQTKEPNLLVWYFLMLSFGYFLLSAGLLISLCTSRVSIALAVLLGFLIWSETPFYLILTEVHYLILVAFLPAAIVCKRMKRLNLLSMVVLFGVPSTLQTGWQLIDSSLFLNFRPPISRYFLFPGEWLNAECIIYAFLWLCASGLLNLFFVTQFDSIVGRAKQKRGRPNSGLTLPNQQVMQGMVRC